MDLTDRVFRFLERFEKPVSTNSFSLFRVLFSLHLLLIISEVFKYRELIFDTIPGVSKNVFPALLFLTIWTVSVLLLLAGAWTRYAAVLNYGCVLLATAVFTNSNVGTFNDDLLRIGSFLVILMPVSRRHSIDAMLRRMTTVDQAHDKTSYLNYILFIFLSLGLLYFPSGITKTYSPMWMHGLGLWTPSNIPHNKWNDIPNFLINQQWLMVSLNFLVIIWEIFMLLFLFFPRLHWLIAIPGVLFHAGIGIMFPFPLVCTGPIVFYSLFIPDRFWHYWANRIRSKEQVRLYPSGVSALRAAGFLQAIDFRQKFVFDDRQKPMSAMEVLQTGLLAYTVYKPVFWLIRYTPLGVLLKVMNRFYLNHGFNSVPAFRGGLLNYKARKGILVVFSLFCLMLQGGISVYHIYSHVNADEKKRLDYVMKRKEGYDLSMKPTNLMRTFFGINSRGLFLDHANSGSKTTYALTYFNKAGEEVWLPTMGQRGYVKWDMNMNLAWAKVTFNLIAFSTNPADSIGLKKLTKFWAMHYGHKLDSLHLKVYKKTYFYPDRFEKDYYLKLEAQPWLTEGEIYWRNGVFSYFPADTNTKR